MELRSDFSDDVGRRDVLAFLFDLAVPSLSLARTLNQIQAFGLRHGMKFYKWWGSAQFHESEQSLVMFRANVTQQVILRLPLRLVAKSLWNTGFLKNPTAQTARLYPGRTRPGYKGPEQLFALCRHHCDTYALDNHLMHLWELQANQLLLTAQAALAR
jgi:hypothetical protein